MSNRVATFLAGGDGDRLKPLTRRLTGDDRPKQFCAVLGAQTLFSQTVDRVAAAIGDGPGYCVVNRAHERFYREALAAHPTLNVLEQPANRGTGTAIIYSLEAARRDHGNSATVGIFPTDHHACPATFQRFVSAAYSQAANDPQHVYLVGAKAERPEADYGWIEAEPEATGYPLAPRAVRSFWEKPSTEFAHQLFERGCLWNTFILVGRVDAFDALIRRAGDPTALAMQQVFRGPVDDERFSRLPALDFSTSILQRAAPQLRVLELRHAGWTDLGRPSRVNEARLLLRLPDLGSVEPTAVAS
jgi:mannose-1-phosphate guanylyltransferase